ncbi:type IV secretion system protein VirB5 [Salmonella enterica subsp. enterica serovar Wichita]|nr:type IV secretion system protein VirB5 [Salmonella enterica subsp. enterica serovar Wichita]
MRKFLISLLAGSVMFFSASSFSSGIPVVDAIANSQEMTHWLEKVKQWNDTVLHYENELTAYKDQLATATGVRDVALFLRQAQGIANDVKSLQQRGISLNDLLTSNGAYTSELNNLYKKYKSFDNCKNSTGKYADTCKQMLINQALAIEETTTVQNSIDGVLSDISDLSNRISYATDSKESTDLANVVAAKSTQLNALTTQWEMSVKQAELRTKMLESKRQSEFIEQQLNAPVADLNNIDIRK